MPARKLQDLPVFPEERESSSYRSGKCRRKTDAIYCFF